LRDVALEPVTVTSRDAAERAFREHGQKLWRSLLAFTGDPELASDSLAEAYAQLLARGPGVRAPERWAWRAAFRIAAGELRERRLRAAPAASAESVEMPEPALDLILALGRLSPNQRAVAILRLYADLSSSEVARILGISQATVRVHLSQARRRLRELLEGTDG
jgi:RNA polymerase sigma factor (sigma-70 family)